jgi:hypothetical protein
MCSLLLARPGTAAVECVARQSQAAAAESFATAPENTYCFSAGYRSAEVVGVAFQSWMTVTFG